MPNKLEMKFDPNVISHLGIQMYSTLPPVLAELISNSYDAEAKKVKIYLNDANDKTIIIEDDGHGMSFQEINSKFLKIGRNRREEDCKSKSKNGKRYVIGKKGIGKLAFFGIANTIKIETTSNFLRNEFILDLDELKEQGKKNGAYSPRIVGQDVKSDLEEGTKITLKSISRRARFKPVDIAYSLSRYFQIFNEDDFEVKIFHNQEEIKKSPLRNEFRFENIDNFVEWEFPLSKDVDDAPYEFSQLIKGKIIASSEKTIPDKMKGIALFSRGKLVSDYSFFELKATSHGYSYITGFLNVDFIEDFEEDVISTNRQSLNWELDDTSNLKSYLEKIIKMFYNYQKVQKEQYKKYQLIQNYDIDVDSWLNDLPRHERKLAQKISNSILNAEGIEPLKAVELIRFTRDSFQFEAFKALATEIDETEFNNPSKIVALFQEWELIEAREMYKLAIGRIKTIEKFEKLIDENAYEVKEIHPFFEKFPWILDPRINTYQHEAQYVKILKENYPDTDLSETNRRIDFLCTSVSNHKFIIEIKRPKHVIKLEDIDQASDYRSFVEDYIGKSKYSPNRVIGYIIGGTISDDRKTKDRINTNYKADTIYVKTFAQLLTEARNYHKEFIDKYNRINSL